MQKCNDKKRPLTILFHTWTAAFDCPGGGEIQLLQYEKHLSAMGVNVLRYDPWNPQFDEVDIVHHFSSQPESLFCEYVTQNRKLPLVISSIFWPDKTTKYDLEHIASTYRLSKRVLPNSIAEAGQIAALLSMPEEYFTPIVNGVNDIFFQKISPEIFRDHFHITGPFILCMSNIEPRKNQLNLIEALKATGIQLVLAGNERNSEYAAQCRAVADDHTHFIGTLEHGGILQRSAYAAAEALVLPSTLETPGLAALEAAAAGVPRVIITSIGCTREYFGNLATYLLPDEIPSIKDAVFRALATPGNSSGLQQHIRNNFTWQHAAHQLMNVYQEILQQQPNEKNSTQPQKQGITLTPNDILLPLSPSKNTEKIPHEGRYIHLSGEEGSCFHQPNIQLCAGHYEFEIEYSWWGSGRDANCILTSKEEKSLASAPLEEGPRRSLRLPFIIGSTTHDISLEIEIPKGCVLIVSWMKIHLNETYFLKQNIMSDIITYGLTTYKRVSEYDTIIPFQHFLLNGTSLCNKDSLLVYSHYHTNITGPYLSLPPGKYAVIMLYAYNKNIFSDSETQFSAYCDISINRGKEILYKKELVPGNNQHIGLPFELKEAVKDLEIRTSIPANYLVHFKKIHLFSFTPLTKKYDPQKKSLYISPFNQLVPEIISSEGWHPHNDEGTWTSTEKSFLNLALLPSNYILTITLTPFLGNKDFRTLHCLINNKEYKITKLYNAKTLFIFVTEDMFNGIPLLSLSFLSTEELTSPQECNLGIDTRKLGFLFHNLTFLPFTEELQREYENKPFSPDMPSIVTADGWHTPEASGTWTATQTASLILNKKPNDYEILLDVAPFLGGICYRTIHCLINGREYKKMKLCGPTTFSIQITQDMFNNSSFLSLTILSEEDLTSPQECNISSDTRKLGFFVHKIVFH